MARPRTGMRQVRGTGGYAQKGGAMSFYEIGQREGLTHSGAVMVFQRGLRKLRESHPLFLAVMMELAEDMAAARAGRIALYDPEALD